MERTDVVVGGLADICGNHTGGMSSGHYVGIAVTFYHVYHRAQISWLTMDASGGVHAVMQRG